MQRATAPAARAAAAAAGARPIAHSISSTSPRSNVNQVESHTTTAVVFDEHELDEDSWNFVVTPQEVTAALIDVGVSATAPTSRPHLRSRSEGSWSSTSTDSSHGLSNDLMNDAEDSTRRFNMLSDVVADLLNDQHVGTAIVARLAQNPSYRQMLREYGSSGGSVTTSAAAAALLHDPSHQALQLTGPEWWEEQRLRGRGQQPDNPLDRFVNQAIQAIVNAFAQIGNFIRRLPEDVAVLLRGLGEGHRGHDSDDVHSSPLHAEQDQQRWETALKRVITAVAVLVLTRRAVLRMA